MADLDASSPSLKIGADPYDLVDVREACRTLGGVETPLDPSTFYRGIAAGIYPAPLKVSRQSSRWRRSELLAVLDRAAAARKGQAA
jgi:predicted DNA-binding transcriptional regulator AlpA